MTKASATAFQVKKYRADNAPTCRAPNHKTVGQSKPSDQRLCAAYKSWSPSAVSSTIASRASEGFRSLRSSRTTVLVAATLFSAGNALTANSFEDPVNSETSISDDTSVSP